MSTDQANGYAPPPETLQRLGSGLRDLVLGAISNSVLVADARADDQPIIWVNSAFERTTGYAATDVIGRNCRFLQGPGTDRGAVEVMHHAIKEGRGCTVTLLNYRKDGSPFWQELSIAPVRDETGLLTHFVGVQTDLTTQRRAEERAREELAARQAAAEEAQRFAEQALQLTEAAKRLAEDAQHLAEERLSLAEERRQLANVARLDAERGRETAEAAIHLRNEVLATVTHDVRSPLTSLRGRLDLVRTRLEGDHELDPQWLGRQIDAVRNSADRIGATLEEMTDVAQLWVGQRLVLHQEEIDLAELAREATSNEAERWIVDSGAAPETTVTVEAAAAPTIAGDRRRLARVIENLVGNALKYGNGKPVQVRVAGYDDRATIEVRDQGVGIPARELPHIFTRFFRATTARGVAGTGIGLAGSKAIVEQHGGAIILDSTEGRGTSVQVTLPRAGHHGQQRSTMEVGWAGQS